MTLPPKTRLPLMIASVAVILFCVISFAVRWLHPDESMDRYWTADVDDHVGWVAAQEAARVTGGKANIIVTLMAPEKKAGGSEEQQAYHYMTGFRKGLSEHPASATLKILATKCARDDAHASMHGWPALTKIEDFSREFPACNLIVLFSRLPPTTPGERLGDPTKLPGVIVVQYPPLPNMWKDLFDTGLVRVIFANKPIGIAQGSGGSHQAREIVEQHYWIVTPSNLDELSHKVGG